MSLLQECQDCHRHIRVTETDCPFCRARSVPGQISRAALLATALAGSATLGCGEKKEAKDPVREPATAPVTAPAIDAATAVVATIDAAAAVIDAGVPDAGVPDAAKAKKKKKKKKVEKVPKLEPLREADIRPPPMPYGAPPARHRLV